MERNKKDILQAESRLKEMPYSVPEGYFVSLESAINDRLSHSRKVQRLGTGRRLAPYLAMTAMFAIMVTAGTFFLRTVTDNGEYTFEDYLVMSDGLTGMITYTLGDEPHQDTLPDGQDIADYLIYTGVDAGAIEF